MASTRKIIRAFLASPGDLQDERRAIKNVIQEFNDLWASQLGYQVELVGWEETVAGYGRPQHIINQELDRCELFLGMIWKKWGTPPDIGGEFTSGFEEEFERSLARREKTGSPEISLFFKDVPSEFMADPGDDLKKVLDFRENVISGKKILFQTFRTTHEIETLLRKCISAYVCRVKSSDESSEVSDAGGKRSSNQSASNEPGGSASSPLSPEGFAFLEGLVEKIRQPDSLDTLSPSEIARFRLLAYSVSKSGNDKMDLGAHDINIMFAACLEGVELGDRELRSLTSLGFKHLANENVPLWKWYSEIRGSTIDPAILSSIAGSDENEKVGAISVLTKLKLDLSVVSEVLERDLILTTWFSENSPSRVRNAALQYLAKCGTINDLAIVKDEYSRSDHLTSRNALECLLEIMLRTGKLKDALDLAIETQFVALDANVLRSLLSGFNELDTPKLLLAIEHRNSEIRLNAFKLLSARVALQHEVAERLTADSDARIRQQAVDTLFKLGKHLSDEEVKKILIQPQKQERSGILSLGTQSGRDSDGEKTFEEYQLNAMKKLTEPELNELALTSSLYEDTAYFALVDKYFRNQAERLRRDVDDKFKTYFEDKVRLFETKFSVVPRAEEVLKGLRDLEDFIRKGLTRKALNVLCEKQKSEDVLRIRSNLRDGYSGASKLDAEYLAKHGQWTDIPLLANSTGPTIGSTLLTMKIDEVFQESVVRAITTISKKHSITDLLSLEMPSSILKLTIDACPDARFEKISHEALMTVFNHESDEVRKSAALKAVRALPVKRIKKLLYEYVVSDNYRFYNVIHWLDLGASMNRSQSREVAKMVGSIAS